MVNIPYHAAQARGKFNRRVYRAGLPWMVRSRIRAGAAVPVAVYSLSCERDLPEQAACLYSFLRHVGTPDRFTVVSDGSYTAGSRRLLEQISPCVSVVDFADIVEKNLPHCVQAYAAQKPLGKKLALELSLPVTQATILVDADVLFFPGASALAGLCRSQDDRPHYLPDVPGALDKRLLRDDAEAEHPANSGFMLLKKPLNWSLALDRLTHLQGPVDYFTEQTLLHLTMHQNGAVPLCPETFVLKIKDQFHFPDRYAGEEIALRHYVSTVRHKFWHSKCWR